MARRPLKSRYLCYLPVKYSGAFPVPEGGQASYPGALLPQLEGGKGWLIRYMRAYYSDSIGYFSGEIRIVLSGREVPWSSTVADNGVFFVYAGWSTFDGLGATAEWFPNYDVVIGRSIWVMTAPLEYTSIVDWTLVLDLESTSVSAREAGLLENYGAFSRSRSQRATLR